MNLRAYTDRLDRDLLNLEIWFNCVDRKPISIIQVGGFWRQACFEYWDGILISPFTISGTENCTAYVGANWSPGVKVSEILFSVCTFGSITRIGLVPNITLLEGGGSDLFIKRYRQATFNQDRLPLTELTIVEDDLKRHFRMREDRPDIPIRIRMKNAHFDYGIETSIATNAVKEILGRYPYPQLLALS